MARSTRLGACLIIACLGAGGAIASIPGARLATMWPADAPGWSAHPGLLRLDSDPPERTATLVDPYTRFPGLDVTLARMVSTHPTGWDAGALAPTPGTWTATWLQGEFTIPSEKGMTATGAPPGSAGESMAMARWLSDRAAILLAVHASAAQQPGAPEFGGAAWGGDAAEAFDLSATLALGESLRIGSGYQSSSGDRQGTLALGSLPALTQALDALGMMQFQAIDGRNHTLLSSPDRIGLGALWRINPDVALILGAQWAHWALMNDLKPAHAGQWRDTWSASATVAYRLTNEIQVQAALGYETGARPGAAAPPGVPAGGVRVGLGLGWTILPGLDAQLGYSHVVAAAAHEDGQAMVVGIAARF